MSFDSGTVDVTLPASAGAVFFAARQVFFELQIPTPLADSSQGYLVNGRFIKLRSLAGFPLSTYLNCGSGMTGPNADAFRIHLAIVARLVPLPNERTRLTVALAAGGTNVSGNAWDPVRCPTRGVLEFQITEKARQLLSAAERKE